MFVQVGDEYVCLGTEGDEQVCLGTADDECVQVV